MKRLLSAIVLAAGFQASAQSFLNGDFENNSASQCEFNLANNDYASKMSHSWAFGSGEEVDIQTFVCGYETPPSNNWFVSLSKDTEGNCDAISLELSQELIAGGTYYLSYLSSALMGSTGLQFGLSTNPQEFGDLLFGSHPVLNLWQISNHTFIAPNNGRYITVRAFSANAQGGWNLLDNLQISSSLSAGEHQMSGISVYPNPSTGQFTIEAGTEISEVKVFNAIGQLVKANVTTGLSSVSFELDADGVYFVNIAIGGQAVTKKIIVSKS